MTPEQRKILRDALVKALVALAPLSISADTLKGTAKAAGFLLDDAALDREIDYICQRGLATEKSVKLSAGVRRWKATADAIEYCEAEGLV